MRPRRDSLRAAWWLVFTLAAAGTAAAATSAPAAADSAGIAATADTVRLHERVGAQLPALVDPASIAVALLATAQWLRPATRPAGEAPLEALRRDAATRIDLARADATTLLLLLALPDNARQLPALPERSVLVARLKQIAGRSMSAWVALLPELPGQAEAVLDGAAAASADDRLYEIVLARARDLYARAIPDDASAAADRAFGLAGLVLPRWSGWFDICTSGEERRARCQAFATTLACSDRLLLNVAIGTALLQRLARTPEEQDRASRLLRWRTALMDASAPGETSADEWLTRIVTHGEVATLAAAAQAAGRDPGTRPCGS